MPSGRTIVIILGIAGCLGHGSDVRATLRESVTFHHIPSTDVLGDPDNTKVSFSLAGGYIMSTLHIRGLYTLPVPNTRPTQCYIAARKPDQGTVNMQLFSEDQPIAGGVVLYSARIGLSGMDPGGAWQFEFFESIDNVPNAPDMVWDYITFEFEDDNGGPTGADVKLCQVFDLGQYARLNDRVGLALATTAWNVGDHNVIWQVPPDSRHPFIVSNLYRLKDDRFEQIGMSWVKHAYYAFSNINCGGTCNKTAGDYLGVGCSDTYMGYLNATQRYLGPRFEINGWSGKFTHGGSVYGDPNFPQPWDTAISRLNQVRDADIDPIGNPGATYFGEGYFLCRDDSNIMNSAGWKTAAFSGAPGGIWTIDMANDLFPTTQGWALDAWTGSQQVVLAQEVPVSRAASPDGRCILASKATPLRAGWHYEYAILNIDMDRQVGSFAIDVPPGVAVSHVGFHAVEHHEEAINYPAALGGVPINNDAWAASVSLGRVTWSTPSNPLRWGMLYNFRFDASTGPTNGPVTLGLFRPGSPTSVTGMTQVPSSGPLPCGGNRGDLNADGRLDGNDLGPFVDCLLGSAPPGGCGCADIVGDGVIDVADRDALVSLLIGS